MTATAPLHQPTWNGRLDDWLCVTCGDELWPCPTYSAAQPPKCKCSHVKHVGSCFSVACGCWLYRPAVTS